MVLNPWALIDRSTNIAAAAAGRVNWSIQGHQISQASGADQWAWLNTFQNILTRFWNSKHSSLWDRLFKYHDRWGLKEKNSNYVRYNICRHLTSIQSDGVCLYRWSQRPSQHVKSLTFLLWDCQTYKRPKGNRWWQIQYWSHILLPPPFLTLRKTIIYKMNTMFIKFNKTQDLWLRPESHQENYLNPLVIKKLFPVQSSLAILLWPLT